MGHSQHDPAMQCRPAWNVVKTIGTKRPLTQKQIWAVAGGAAAIHADTNAQVHSEVEWNVERSQSWIWTSPDSDGFVRLWTMTPPSLLRVSAPALASLRKTAA
jgi:hypothetical protein